MAGAVPARGLAFIWLATGLGVLHPAYRLAGAASLEALGLPAWLMIAACLGEILLGLRVLLGRAATWLVALQIAGILTFSVILSISERDLWLDPWSRLTKNLPLVVMLAVLWLVEREGWTPRRLAVARRPRVPLAVGRTDSQNALGHLDAVDDFSAGVAAPRRDTAKRGVRRRWRRRPRSRHVGRTAGRFVWRCAAKWWRLVAALLLGSFQEPLLWVHPFGPLTKNVPWLLGTLVCWWLTKEDRSDEP